MRGPVVRGSHAADRLSVLLLGGGYFVVAVWIASGTTRFTEVDAVALLALVMLYAVADRTIFRHQVMDTVPTEPVLVAILFLVPLHLVPIVVAAGRVLSDPGMFVSKALGRRLLIALGQSWACVGAVVVLQLAHLPDISLRHWPVYVAALAAQATVDWLTTLFRAFAMGDRLRELFREMSWTLAVDACLATITVCSLVATSGNLWSIPLAAAPVGLVALLAMDRRQLADSSEQLGEEVVTAREEARIDPLTGLGNRRAWYQAVTQTHARLGAEGSVLVAGVLTADLNGLKRANDLHGHDFGDRLIVKMAELTSAAMPADALVCRMGGDEFTVLVVRPADELDMHVLGEELRVSIDATDPVDGFQLSAAIGTAVCPPAPDLNAALRFADAAAYADKRSSGLARHLRMTPPLIPSQASTDPEGADRRLIDEPG